MSEGFTLAIDGATGNATVALLDASRVVAERTVPARDPATPGGGGAEHLMPAVADCMNEAGVKMSAIGRVVCGAGPGSFTGLRVAASIGKGLAVGRGVRMYAVSSLLLTVTGKIPALAEGDYTSVLSAMRGEWFAADVQLRDGVTPTVGAARRVATEELRAWSEREGAGRIIGPGQEMEAFPHARGIAPLLGGDALLEVDIETWEPDYGRLAEAQVKWEAAHGRALSR
ncbi:MAG TPA: tRNA (adenosine(37)-N6)-threonylcarbamoyltransferase complex dimerization subunit type 1 TsaB [Gemmatimonadaceae bacterium]|nr:tRNA (adenosine(37)-N6)-threonylcarbamoyltransferase complex dimerization subunit type 1 TsaB [Gemmatimonadaceae bacterium]